MALIDKSYFFGDLEVAQKSQSTVEAALQWFIDEYEPKLLTELLGYELYRDFKAGLQVDPIADKWLDLLYGKEYTNRQGTLTKWGGLLQVADIMNPGTYYPDDIEIIISGALIGATTYTNSFLVGKSFRVVQRGFGPLGSDITINSNGFTLNEGVFIDQSRYYIEFTAPVPLPTPVDVTPGTAKKSLIANYVYYWYSRQQATGTTGTGEKELAAQNAINASAVTKQMNAWNKMVDWVRDCREFLLTNDDDYPQYTDTVGQCNVSEVYAYKNSFGL